MRFENKGQKRFEVTIKVFLHNVVYLVGINLIILIFLKSKIFFQKLEIIMTFSYLLIVLFNFFLI